MTKFYNIVEALNFKTLRFNFKYLPFKQAVKLPILVSRNCRLRRLDGKVIIRTDNIYTGMIKIGFDGISIFDNKKSRSIWQVSGTVIFEGKTSIGHGSKIDCSDNGHLVLGENFIISAESTIICSKKVSFGSDCMLSWDVLIMDTDLHGIFDKDGIKINGDSPVEIGSNVWVGCRATILKGVRIADGTIIAATSTITKHIQESHNIVGGNPISILKKEVTWKI